MNSTLTRTAFALQSPANIRGFAPLLRVIPLLVATIGISLSIGSSAQAQSVTAAGTSINNQAAISYDDESGLRQTATSNPITTLVQQVAGVNLETDNTRNAVPLTNVTFPHIITNTGNGSDKFILSATDQASGDNFNIAPKAYADADGNGVPDGLLGALLPSPITESPVLAPGETYQFVVIGSVPLLASGSATVNVRATSNFNSSTFDSNVDVVNTSNNAIVDVVKSVDKTSGTPNSGPYTYTLTYTNSTNKVATNLNIVDALPLGVTYVPNSGTWSGSATALTDADGGDPSGVNYSYTTLLPPRTVTATIATVPANSVGRITFKVNIDNGLLAGLIGNFATYTYNDGSILPQGGITNTVNISILQLAAVLYLGEVKVAATQNSTVTFNNLLTNVGTSADSFNIVLNQSSSTFPAGTTFLLYQSDGVTPLTDTNNDNVPDTGSLPPLGTYVVVIKAKLPPSATTNLLSSVTSTASSIYDSSKTATALDSIAAILPGSVDLTNALNSLGVGPGPELLPVTNLLVDLLTSGDTNRQFELWIKNNGADVDNFDLSVSADGNFPSLVNYPDGVSVVFKTEAGATITNTGPIAAGASIRVFAEVKLPAGLPAVQLKLYFRVFSQVTGLSDIKYDAITINDLRSITLTPNNNGQTFAGGSIIYTHILKNNGTTPEGGLTSTIALTTSNTGSGFTSLIYRDGNANNSLDDSDPLVTSIDSILLPTASTTLFVRVSSPNGVPSGTTNTTTLTATTTGGLPLVAPPPAVSVTDLTTVLSSQLTIQKLQALDSNGDGTPDGPYTSSTLTTGALPGRVIRYQILVTNTGAVPINNAVVTDAIPANTTYDVGDGSPNNGIPDGASWFNGTTHTPISGPVNGTLTFNVGTIAPSQVIIITFGVKIN
jgi:uncharacterized repeat protein (TIGR01451 family)